MSTTADEKMRKGNLKKQNHVGTGSGVHVRQVDPVLPNGRSSPLARTGATLACGMLPRPWQGGHRRRSRATVSHEAA